MSDIVGLDFETYGSVDLPAHGLDRYVSDPHFRVLLACVHYQDSRGIRATSTFDFTGDYVAQEEALMELLGDKKIAAHNAGFERAVLRQMGYDLPASRFVDTAVVARAAGAAGSLGAAAPQLLDADKMEEGIDLIKLFSIPGKYQEASGERVFDPQIVEAEPVKWATFIQYCCLDAELCYDLAIQFMPWISPEEMAYQAITMDMNRQGWHVDVPTVVEMQKRYWKNLEAAMLDFRAYADPQGTLNLNSTPQLIAWCGVRGVRAKSFDEKHVASLGKRITIRLSDGTPLTPEKRRNYEEIKEMLKTKQILGGSSLKKLKVILDQVGEDDMLRDQYLHCGAGQTLRTTGRGVQMQNLKRLANPYDMASLGDSSVFWSNTELAENLRQVFTSRHPKGALVVGDFRSVENVGLAYLAGAEEKLNAIRAGADMYKLMARKIFKIPGEIEVLDQQRQTGKVGELSCGYNAGPEAVVAFAAGMGITITEAEAGEIVFGWRDANPEIVDLWLKLHVVLRDGLLNGRSYVHVGNGLQIQVQHCLTPASLLRQKANVQSLEVSLEDPHTGKTLLRRYFHGCYLKGRNIVYFRPSSNKTGDLWKDWYTDPKTGLAKDHTIYGGKLSGILTQSLCREIFFEILVKVSRWASTFANVTLMGQFHDEIVLDWEPNGISLDQVEVNLKNLMSIETLSRFPLSATVKSDYRYIK